MADVMQQRRQPQIGLLFLVEPRMVEIVEHPAHDAKYTETVGKSRMSSVRINEVAHAELFQRTQSLKSRSVYDLPFVVRQGNVAVDVVVDDSNGLLTYGGHEFLVPSRPLSHRLHQNLCRSSAK